MFDWTKVLDSTQGDQSLEAELARREMARQQQILMGVSKEVEARRQNRAEEDFRNRQLQENAAYRTELQKDRDERTQYQREQQQQTEKRQRYNQVQNNLLPGHEYPKDVVDLVTEYEGPGGFTPKQNYGPQEEGATPDAWIYKKHEADVAASKAERDQALKDANEARAAESQKISQAHLKIAQDKEVRDKQAADDLHKKRVAAASTQGKLESKIPPELRQSFNKRRDEIYASGQHMFGSDEENMLSATQKAYEEFTNNPVFGTRIPPAGGERVHPSGGGRGGPPQNETPEQRIQRLLGKQ